MQPMPETLYDRPEIEYLDGRPYPKVSPRLTHGRVQGALCATMIAAAQSRGVVGTEVRFDPGAIDGTKTELVPDVAYISNGRLLPLSEEAREKPPFSPDIAVEVRSPSDDLNLLARKIVRYLATGAILVLDVDPQTRRIIAHAADGIQEFTAGETFAHPAAPWLRFGVDSVMR
jgi:Uma2 family endonuclease